MAVTTKTESTSIRSQRSNSQEVHRPNAHNNKGRDKRNHHNDKHVSSVNSYNSFDDDSRSLRDVYIVNDIMEESHTMKAAKAKGEQQRPPPLRQMSSKEKVKDFVTRSGRI